MKHVQQKTERRISAALRLVSVALLLLLQIALVVALTMVLKQRMLIAYTVLELAAAVYAVQIFLRPGSTGYKIGWILLVLAVPVAGVILFWLWNGNKVKKKLALKNIHLPAETAEVEQAGDLAMLCLQETMPHWRRLAGYLRRRGFPLYENACVTYLPSGEAYLEDLLEKLQAAQRFIFLEYYIVATGQIWTKLRQILMEKAAAGVEIKLLFDDFGSMMRMPGEEIRDLRQGGVDIRFFNPVHQYVNRLYFNYRDHRKIAVIDGDIAYTGGVNLADEYANLVERFGYWKDCGIRLEGACVWGLTRSFLYLWRRMDGQFSRTWDEYRPRTEAAGDSFCLSFTDGPDNNPIDTAEDTFLQLINCASHQVWITTPYLAIDENMVRALSIAADSGLDVRLMLPGIPDHRLAYIVAKSYWGELLHHGVKIYTYTPGLLHGKSVVADGEMAFVGSVNMDFRSFQLHFECGSVFSGSAASAVEQDMERIMDESLQVAMAAWKRRKWYEKLLGTLLRPFAMWM